MPPSPPRSLVRSAMPAVLIVLGQALTGLFFIADSFSDFVSPQRGDSNNRLEICVALALAAGIILGAIYLVRLAREARARTAVVALAKGALSDLIVQRFADWHLTASEADVALFALKGCSIQDIAELRSTAAGTVRAQLSQVYAKAGVSSQTMLMSLFLEDLMGEIALERGS